MGPVESSTVVRNQEEQSLSRFPVCSRLRIFLVVSLASLLLQVPGAYAHGLRRNAAQIDPSRTDLLGRTTAIPLAGEMAILLAIKDFIVQHNPGSALENWSSGSTDPCSWNGIRCGQGPEGLHVTEIDLSSNNFIGRIPQGWGKLTYLTSLSLAYNDFIDEIPRDLPSCFNLISLDLSSNQLLGRIPENLTNLSNLRSINLSYNNLEGGIPDTLFSTCNTLQSFNISGNERLQGNLPLSLKNCRSLTLLDVSNCSLQGEIPEDLFSKMPLMFNLVLRENHFEGDIPPGLFSSCGSLQSLDLAMNNFTGHLPPEIENCSGLTNLALSANKLRSIPKEIGSLVSLERLLIVGNQLTELPLELAKCSRLKSLAVSENLLSGPVPEFLSTLEDLEFLSLYDNRFTGQVPTWLGGLSSLRHLDASNNDLTGSIPSSITGAAQLQFLLLANNQITGSIPEAIGEKLLNLQVLDLSHNALEGGIPPTFGNLKSLLWLMLADNRLTGEIPSELGNCSSLLWLNAANNRLSGSLPESLASIGNNVNKTFELNFKTLPIIPKGMGECSAVERWIPSKYPPFDLISHVMTVERCRSFWNLLMRGVFMYPLCPSRPATESMGYIQLASNLLTGSIPPSLSTCQHLGLLFLDQNNFTGRMPETYPVALTGLNVSRNGLTGYVPRSIGALTCMVSLDLSYNNLSGRIPPELQNLTQLNRFNISYNPELVGPIPIGQQFSTFGTSVYEGDSKLCIGSSLVSTNLSPNSSSGSKLPACGENGGDGVLNSRKGSRRSSSSAAQAQVATVVGVSLACTLGLIVLVLLGFCLLGKAPPAGNSPMDFMMVGGKEHRHFGPDAVASVQVSLFSVELPKHLTYSDLVSATSNFDECNVVGSGGFGVVYKAKLGDGSTVAIKKLIQEGPQADREFLAEMETLGHLHHENLVPLLGCSSCGTQKLLVYKFMENGSLDDWLHERPGGAEALVWPIRLNVALGIARGLKFLHHNCSPPIVHRDMKASNILLDENFEPRLTDFGLARVLGAQETHVSTVVAGTLGYVPPEYCQTWRATARGDVYSFGVVLLELVTGKRPMSICFGEKDCGGNLIEWAAYHVKKGIAAEVCDRIVLRSAAPGELLAFLRLAVICTAELPIRRPTMREVLKVLEEIKAGNYGAMVSPAGAGGGVAQQFR